MRKKEQNVNEEEKMMTSKNEACSDDCSCGCHNEEQECTCRSQELEEANKLIEEYKNKLLYKEAEFVNFRKRKDDETASLLKYANQDLILEIINSVDNFERAIESIKKDDEADNAKILTGIDMIYQELKATLTKFGVKEISEVGVLFDENVHHAVMVDNDSSKEDGVILEVMIKGYQLFDRLIRPAMVKVNQL